MHFEYKIDMVMCEKELEHAINDWAKLGYEPHNICTLSKRSAFSNDIIPVLALIIRKAIKKPRTPRRKKNEK